MKFVLNLLLLSSFIVSDAQNLHSKENTFIPDTTINKKLILLNSQSIERNIGDQTDKLIQDEAPSRVQFTNKRNSEYLILYHVAGSNSNFFNEFEIGLLKRTNKTFKRLDLKSFTSEGGIKINIGMDSLISIKGKNFNRRAKDGYTIITYIMNNPGNRFLKRFNMPIYSASYYFKEGKLVRFIFGFPNL